MQPVPTYETLPVVFDTAPQTAIPNPTIDSGYGEGVALPVEHFSWLEYKVTKKITELATSTLSLLGELDSYLSSRGVTPSGASVTQFQTALAAQIAGASVASAAACTGNAATATSAGQCTGNSTTATTAANCTGNAATATTAANCTGNAATATTAANCTGNATTATALTNCGFVASSRVPGTSGQMYTCIGFTSAGTFFVGDTVPGGTILGGVGMLWIRQA